MINSFIAGATTLGYFIAAAYFLKFQRRTRDRLFLLFATAFAMMGAQRIAMLFWSEPDERGQVLLYGLRLLAFVLILVAIIDKNRVPATSSTREHQKAI